MNRGLPGGAQPTQHGGDRACAIWLNITLAALVTYVRVKIQVHGIDRDGDLTTSELRLIDVPRHRLDGHRDLRAAQV